MADYITSFTMKDGTKKQYDYNALANKPASVQSELSDTDGGWKELTNSELGDLTSLTTGNKNSIVDAVNELKTMIDTSLVTYSLDITEDGSVRCLKNGNEDGFELGADGSVQIA